MILIIDQKNRAFIVIQNDPRVSIDDPASVAPKLFTSIANLAFDHLLDQLVSWFVYIDDSPLAFSAAPETLVPSKVKAPRCDVDVDSDILTTSESLWRPEQRTLRTADL